MTDKKLCGKSGPPQSSWEHREIQAPGRREVVESARSAGWLLLVCCFSTLLASCGGGDDSAAAASPVAPSAVAPALPAARAATGGGMGAASAAALQALPGQAIVTLNALPPPGPDAAASAATVAVRRGPDGALQLIQRDGATRTLSPDGKLTLQPAGTAAPPGGDLPASVMVAVDASNTVHVVDPQACLTRRVAPDGRVTMISLPAPGAGQACAAASLPR
jgi:hypothetical protein